MLRPPSSRARASPGLPLVGASFAAFAWRNGARGDLLELGAYAAVAAGALLMAGAMRSPTPARLPLLAGALLAAGALAASDAAHFLTGGSTSSATAANLLWAWGFAVLAWHALAWAQAWAPERRARGMALGLALAGVAYAEYLLIVATRVPEPLLLAGHAAGLAGAAHAARALASPAHAAAPPATAAAK